MHSIIKSCFLCLSLSFSFFLFAKPLVVQKILNNETADLSHTLKKERGVLFFFKPDCPSCRAQVGELQCLEGRGELLAFGFSLQRRDIWVEAKKLKLARTFKENIFYADDETLKIFGIKNKLSPQVFTFSKGAVTKRFLGLIECNKILAELESTR